MIISDYYHNSYHHPWYLFLWCITDRIIAGCTAIVAVHVSLGAKRVLFIANAGNSPWCAYADNEIDDTSIDKYVDNSSHNSFDDNIYDSDNALDDDDDDEYIHARITRSSLLYVYLSIIYRWFPSGVVSTGWQSVGFVHWPQATVEDWERSHCQSRWQLYGVIDG